MDKVIFLDIDGVLNCVTTPDRIHYHYGIEPAKVDILREIVERTGAVVVLSSSWRTHLNDDMTAATPIGAYLLDSLKGVPLVEMIDRFGTRGEEISRFVYARHVSSYVILDDESHDFKRCGMADRWVKTSWKTGLTAKHVAKVCNVFNRQIEIEERD